VHGIRWHVVRIAGFESRLVITQRQLETTL
jgi:hypothetical protein